jgi:hypothetical protein
MRDELRVTEREVIEQVAAAGIILKLKTRRRPERRRNIFAGVAASRPSWAGLNRKLGIFGWLGRTILAAAFQQNRPRIARSWKAGHRSEWLRGVS